MSDSFQYALTETLPILQSLNRGLSTPPRASRAVLDALRQSGAPAAPRPGPTQSPDIPTSLPALRKAALTCTLCPQLVRSRKQVVFGAGNPRAELLFVGEAPGTEEDTEGQPFVGEAGQLLTKIIQAMGFTRDDVYLASVVKCRPDVPPDSADHRKPKPDEIASCLPWLEQQIALIGPRVIVALGATAIEGLLGNLEPVGKLRGRWLEFRGIPVMTTYHPSYLIHKPSTGEKRKVWEDMLQVLEKLNRPISDKQRRFFT